MSIPFKHSPAEVVRQTLIDFKQGVAGVWSQGNYTGLPWPIFTDVEPPLPDNLLIVTDTTPVSDGRSMVGGESYQHWGFQIKVRGVNKPTAFMKADALRVFLNEDVYAHLVTLTNHQPGQPPQGPSTYTLYCFAQVNLLRLGLETQNSKRFLYTINGLVTIDPLT